MGLAVHELFSLVLILSVLLAVLSIVDVSRRNGISPMPASARVRRVVAAEVNRLSGQGLIVEAGSGWGTLAIHVAKYCKGWRLIGFENSPIPLWVSQIAAFLTIGVHPKSSASPASSGSSKPTESSSASSSTDAAASTSVAFRRGNIYEISYAAADLVLCYLYPGAMKKLDPILRDQLSPEATVISICFAIPGWQPERIITCGDLYRTRVYVYKKNS